ncbi:MAG: 16S rRNA (adenine(1518)-N(6)/adenine(1519)-N(6))-dimethyltransferase RsmA [Burkholderiales bacterium]|nr:16S rRNA (adenine(1518)-N(6)/adenine(1519)-N(6))-dimethyltransferase RsmA [Burkholderiales bacterium]
MRPHRARRRFGQNFLVDEGVVDAIVAAVAPRREDAMLEIGPGLGALTRPLARRLARLQVIEIDRDIVARLRSEFAGGNLLIHEGDALDFEFAAPGGELRVVGNLPYNISTPLLFHLARHAAAIRDIHVMLQKEVVERMVAEPSSSAYGRLSVMLQYRFALERVLEVPAAAFRPAPAVHSALVRMTPHRPLPHPARDEATFAAIVAAAFSQRRKTLRNTLKARFDAARLAQLGIDPGLRAQDLAVADFVLLADDAATGIVGRTADNSLQGTTRE